MEHRFVSPQGTLATQGSVYNRENTQHTSQQRHSPTPPTPSPFTTHLTRTPTPHKTHPPRPIYYTTRPNIHPNTTTHLYTFSPTPIQHSRAMTKWVRIHKWFKKNIIIWRHISLTIIWDKYKIQILSTQSKLFHFSSEAIGRLWKQQIGVFVVVDWSSVSLIHSDTESDSPWLSTDYIQTKRMLHFCLV